MRSRSLIKIPEWMETVIGLLIVALVSWGCANVLDVQARIVRLETQVAGIQHTLDRIDSNTTPHESVAPSHDPRVGANP